MKEVLLMHLKVTAAEWPISMPLVSAARIEDVVLRAGPFAHAHGSNIFIFLGTGFR